MLIPDPDTSRRHRPSVAAVVLFVALSVLLVGVMSTFYVTYSTAYVDGISMEPTLLSGELVLVTRGYDQPLRGDVIVIDLAEEGQPPDILVKRLVGLPGDEIVVKEGVASINGEPEKGDHTVYIAQSDLSVPRQTVPDGRVFVLGDNRPISEDSRIFGTVPLENVLGEVVAVFMPLEDARYID